MYAREHRHKKDLLRRRDQLMFKERPGSVLQGERPCGAGRFRHPKFIILFLINEPHLTHPQR